MSAKINVVGIGPGSYSYVLPVAIELVGKCKYIFGAKRQLEAIEKYVSSDAQVFETFSHDEIAKKVYEILHLSDNISADIAILVSGDTGIFSLYKILKNSFDKDLMNVIPGVSSLAYFAAAIKDIWVDAAILSMHGRYPINWLKTICVNEMTYIFCGGENTPDAICRRLLDFGLINYGVNIGENLSMPEERIISGSLNEIANMKFEEPAIMCLKRLESIEHKDISKVNERLELCSYAFPDEWFIRSEVPMTKEEIRAITLSKLRLKPDCILFDVGAGTGSVSVEAGLLLTRGEVYAIERNTEAIALIKQNIDAFGIDNIKVVNAQAPEGLDDLPIPDRVFVGGSGDMTEEIVRWAAQRIIGSGKNVRIVMNAITIDTVYCATKALEKEGFTDIEVILVSVNKSVKAASKLMLKALNPVYIISAEGQDGTMGRERM